MLVAREQEDIGGVGEETSEHVNAQEQLLIIEELEKLDELMVIKEVEMRHGE